jgi:hypothetical protein
MNLAISLRSEILKTKRTASFYFTLIGAAVVPVVFLLNVMMDGIEDTRQDPLNQIFKLESEMNGLAFFPWFIILVCTLLPQIEFKNNTWKQVLSSPQTKANLFLAKFLNIHLLMLLFLVSTHLFMFIAIGIANFVDPGLGLLNYSLDGQKVWINAANAYVTMLAVCSIQFWLGLRFKNFIVPIAVGLALWLIGTILAFEYHSSLVHYFPYSFQVFNFSPKLKPDLDQIAWKSAAFAVVVLCACFWDFTRKEVNK